MPTNNNVCQKNTNKYIINDFSPSLPPSRVVPCKNYDFYCYQCQNYIPLQNDVYFAKDNCFCSFNCRNKFLFTK